MRITFRYKSYPGADDLTKRSEKVARLTHPVVSLVYAAVITFVLYQITGILEMLVFAFPVVGIIMIILLRKVKKNSEAKQDAQYANRKQK